MYREEDIQKTMKLFGEMASSELVKDEEVQKLNKISKIIDLLNTGDRKQSQYLDELYKEILGFRDIVADKYVRIGICLERVE